MGDVMVYSAALMMGLFSAPHCVGMCGGLVAAMGMSINGQSLSHKLAGVLKYNLGRLISYTVLGIVGGLLGAAFSGLVPQAGWSLRIIAATLLILSGLYIGGWWFGLRHLEQALFALWNRIKGLTGNKRPGLLIAGLTWGCMPCGLVYTALTMAMTQQNALQGGLFMLSFGLGTLPVLVGVGVLSTSFGVWLKKGWAKTAAGLGLVCYGIWTLATA